MTNYQYHGNDRFQPRSQYRRNQYQLRNRFIPIRSNRTKYCFICKKEDCWSTNHSELEQKQAKEKFKAIYTPRFINRFGDRFNKSYSQYVMEYEGNDDSVEEAFQSISLDYSNTKDIDFKGEPKDSKHFITYIGKMSVTDAKAITLDLYNNSFLYLSSLSITDELSSPLTITDG